MDCLENSQQMYEAYCQKIPPHKTFLISAKEGHGVGNVLLEVRRMLELQR